MQYFKIKKGFIPHQFPMQRDLSDNIIWPIKYHKTGAGFTLIELLVVIAIIGLLASVVMVSLNSARSKARDAKRKADLKQITSALEMYYDDNNAYPISNCLSSPGWNCWGSKAQLSDPSYPNRLIPSNYISYLPQDPIFIDNNACPRPNNNLTRAYYYYSDNGQRYILATHLENPGSDANYSENIGGCSGFANWAVRSGL